MCLKIEAQKDGLCFSGAEMAGTAHFKMFYVRKKQNLCEATFLTQIGPMSVFQTANGLFK